VSPSGTVVGESVSSIALATFTNSKGNPHYYILPTHESSHIFCFYPVHHYFLCMWCFCSILSYPECFTCLFWMFTQLFVYRRHNME
jgi:hypothetical protein